MWRAGKANSSKLIFWWIACRCWSLWTTKHWVKEWFSVQRAILASKRVKYSVEHFGRGLESVCFVFSKCRRCQKWSDVQSNSQHQLRRCSQHEQRRAGEPPSPGGRLILLSTYSPSSHLLSSSPSHLATYSPTLEIKKILSSRGRTKQPTTCPTSLARSSSSPSSSSTKTTSLLSLMLTGPSPGKLKKVENNLNRNLQRRCLGVRPPLSSWNHPSSGILLIWRGWCWWWRTECNCCFFFLF